MAAQKKGDLSVTALYTSATWRWGDLSCSEHFETKEARTVFRVVNLAIAFMRVFRWRLRSLKHSLVHRHTMIDHLVTQAQPAQVLELASGLSRRGAAFSQRDSLQYTELDLPSVIEHKRRLLSRTKAGQEVAQRPNLKWVGGDVTSTDLGTLVSSARPLFVIAEGLFMYLQPEEQRRLWERIAELLGDLGGIFVFDLVPTVEQPRPGLIGRALEWVMKRFTGGRSFTRDERTRHDLAAEISACGFNNVECIEPAQIANEWQLPFPDVPTQQLLFVCRRTIEPTTAESDR
jgi:O-methyltransferase involved in polyketide biosynthesis